MIFVAVGTQKFQMNRLLKGIDNCIEDRDITEKVLLKLVIVRINLKIMNTVLFYARRTLKNELKNVIF